MEAIVLQSVVATNSLMGGFLTLVLFYLKRSYPKSIKGLREWVAFAALATMASGLYATQGQIHHLISMALPNVLIVSALLLMLKGTCEHFERKISNKRLYVIAFLALVAFSWMSGKSEYLSYRLVLMSSFFATVLVTMSVILWPHRKGSFPVWFVLCATVPLVAIDLIRAITALLEPVTGGLFNFSIIQTLYLSGTMLGMVILSIFAILAATEKLRKELQKMVKYDDLTGALSRRALYEYAEDEFARSRRLGTALSVLLLDLDHFKHVNDRFGHQVGDKVLSDFVHLVQEVLRRPSAIGRYGGEEFMVLLPDADIQQAILVAERIQKHLRNHLVQPTVTVSIGAASWTQNNNDTLDSMISRADSALYIAKENGRDQISFSGTEAICLT